jgi:hypothetical protein
MTINNINTIFSKIWKIASTEYQLLSTEKNFNNLDQFNKNLWDIVNLNLNLSIFLIWLETNYTNKTIKEYQQKHQIPKKIIALGNSLKNIKFKINSSNEYNISEHFDFINNEPIKLNNIETGKSYFIKINEYKYFLIKIDSVSNSIIKSSNYQFEFNKYLLYHYPPNLQITNNYNTNFTVFYVSEMVKKGARTNTRMGLGVADKSWFVGYGDGVTKSQDACRSPSISSNTYLSKLDTISPLIDTPNIYAMVAPTSSSAVSIAVLIISSSDIIIKFVHSHLLQ